MSDNWVVQMLTTVLNTWNSKLAEIWSLITMSPQEFKGGAVWGIVVTVHNALTAIGIALLVLFFVVGVMKTCGNFAEIKRPEVAVKVFIRFIIAKAVVTYGMELMLALLSIIQGVISTIMQTAGFGEAQKVVLPEEMIAAIKNTSKMTNAEIISSINTEWNNQMEALKSEYGDLTTEGSRASWPEVFALFNAKAAGSKETEWDKYLEISRIFWDMHVIVYEVNLRIEGATVVEKPIDIHMQTIESSFWVTKAYQVVRVDNQTYQNTKKAEEILKDYEGRKATTSVKVYVKTRTLEEMEELYEFDDWQKGQVKTMTSDEFDSFWMETIYGINGGDSDIVNVALTQVGNTGGYPYWAYCGFPSRVEWCACFVSWCAGQCGYVDAGLIPNTGSPPYQVQFFRSQGHWLDGSATPSPGMIIFFDWYNADFADHVGIVEKVEGNIVYTVEGNSSDSVRQKQWTLGDSRIMGYGYIEK